MFTMSIVPPDVRTSSANIQNVCSANGPRRLAVPTNPPSRTTKRRFVGDVRKSVARIVPVNRDPVPGPEPNTVRVDPRRPELITRGTRYRPRAQLSPSTRATDPARSHRAPAEAFRRTASRRRGYRLSARAISEHTTVNEIYSRGLKCGVDGVKNRPSNARAPTHTRMVEPGRYDAVDRNYVFFPPHALRRLLRP